MSQISVNDISSLDGKSGPVISGITTVSSTGYMMIPAGPTEYRGGRGRGIWAGGRLAPTPATVYTNSIEYVQISTLSDTLDFGDLSSEREHVNGSALASSTRGIWAGGYGATGEEHISYIEISSTGNSFDFGDLTGNCRAMPSHSNNTRGIFGPHYNAPTVSRSSQIQYITIATTGNAAEFGNSGPSLSGNGAAGVGDSTRAVFCGGYIGPAKQNIIHYITISSFGDSIDFGDLTDISTNSASASGSGRGIIAGGRRTASPSNIIDYITIQSLGDAIDFGDLTSIRNDWKGGASNGTRAIFAGGYGPSFVYDDSMDYVEIMTTGNAQDFGNLSAGTRYKAGCSDAHGGLG